MAVSLTNVPMAVEDVVHLSWQLDVADQSAAAPL
jgi:hypothetical protein